MRRPGSLLLSFLAVLGAACGDTSPPFFVETLVAADTVDGTGSYGVTTIVRDDRRVKWVRLHYQVGLSAAPITVELQPGEAADLWLGHIPGPGRQTRIYYALEASDEDGNLGRDPALAPDTYSFAVEPRPPLHPDAGSEDVATGDGGTGDASAEDAGLEDVRLEDGPSPDTAAEDATATDGSAEDRAPEDAAGDA